MCKRKEAPTTHCPTSKRFDFEEIHFTKADKILLDDLFRGQVKDGKRDDEENIASKKEANVSQNVLAKQKVNFGN